MPSEGFERETLAKPGRSKIALPRQGRNIFAGTKEIDRRQAWSHGGSVAIVVDRFQKFC
jgi:hypothetical protein